MQLVERRVKLPRGISEVEVILSSCWHIGHVGTDEAAINALVDYIAEKPSRFLILLGDVIDAINPADKRWNPKECAPWVTAFDLADIVAEQARRAAGMIARIPRAQLLGIVEGNHERRVRTDNFFDVHRFLCDEVKAQSLGTQAFLRLVFSGRDRKDAEPITLYLEHGSGGAATPEAVLTKLKKQAMKHPGADAVVGGHHHKWAAAAHTSAGLKHGAFEIQHSEIPVVTSGCFLRYFKESTETYGAVFGLPVPAIGPTKLALHPWGPASLPAKVRHNVQRVAVRYPWWS